MSTHYISIGADDVCSASTIKIYYNYDITINQIDTTLSFLMAAQRSPPKVLHVGIPKGM